MLRLILRPMLVILTLGMLLVALFQVAGRITFAVLDDLEPAVNRLLAVRDMRVTGLSGDWRMLNPVLRAERFDLPAGYVEGLVLEVDMVESVLRGLPLARRLKVGDARIDLQKRSGEPWRLAGTGAGAELDPLPLLRYSSQLELDGGVRFLREGTEPAEVRFRYVGLNRGGEHRHALELSNHPDDCVDPCRLQLDYFAREGLWPLRAAQARVEAHSAGFLLPRTVLGFSPLQITHLELGWQQLDEDTGGTLSVHTEQFDMPGDVTLATRLEGSVRGRDGVQTGAITRWRVAQDDEVWTLPVVELRSDVDGFSAWMPELDLERAGTFLRQALGGVGPAERWLGALQPRGRAHNVRLRYDFGGAGLAYALTLDRLAMDGYKGVPTVRGASGELLGYGRGLQLNLNAQDLTVAFPDVFLDTWDLPYAQGAVQAWFGADYFGIRGLNLRAETLGARAAGGFAMTRPPDREGQRLLLLVSTNRIGVAEAKQFVPYKLPDQLRSWLQTAPRGGVLEDARLAYQGQFQDEPGELGRRLELATRLRDGQLRYHADWPVITGLTGDLAIAGTQVEMAVDTAISAGAVADGSRVRVLDNGATVEVNLDAETLGADLLTFVRTTPLAQWLDFVEPDWRSDGPLRLSGELRVPLGDDGRDPGVRLRADLEGVDLALPGYRVELRALTGSFRYRYPRFVDAAGVAGELFGEPVTIAARTETDPDGERVHVRFDGRARPEDVWRTVAMADPGVASGAFDFQADLGIAVVPGVDSNLGVTSALQGLELRLPAGYGKAAAETVPADVELTFRPDVRALRFAYRDAAGWLLVDEEPLRGAIGFAAEPLAEDAQQAAELVLGGRLAGFDLDDVLPGEGNDAGLPMALRLADLRVDRIGVGEFTVNGATLSGAVTRSGFELDVDSDEVVGHLSGHADDPIVLALQAVNVPVGEDAGGDDPLSPAIIAELPAANVSIDRLMLGPDDYGSWRFDLRPAGDDLKVDNLLATVRGVTVEAAEPLQWRGASNETRFSGRLDGGNLAEVLPQWGYAPNVETESATLTGAFAWDGSPLAVDLLKLRGEAEALATEGRFLEVESGAGAQRIFSLLNFTAIAKRMALNFGDVFGRGISFDELKATIAMDEGLLSFVEPMEVSGTGSRFRVSGSVDLDSGRLDNDMLVTLPVSQSLPWYAAYVALANPLAGLGVLVGERVLRKPLEQFSSARYRIGGTLENPDVKFVSVFDVAGPEDGDGTAVEGDSAPEGRTDAATEAPEPGGSADTPGATGEQAVTGGPVGAAEQEDASDDE